MSRTKIKQSIIDISGHKCDICAINEWQNQKLCLEVDHIDGNNRNNLLSNLRLLCPNCHSQTSTFRGRNKNSGTTKVSDEELYDALLETNNIRQALIKLGLTPKGGNYKRAYTLLNGVYQKPIQTTNSQYNTCWINNGSSNKKIKKCDLIEYESVGWKLGRIVALTPPNLKGRFWVTNGAINKMLNYVPDGFWKGRIVNSKK